MHACAQACAGALVRVRACARAPSACVPVMCVPSRLQVRVPSRLQVRVLSRLQVPFDGRLRKYMRLRSLLSASSHAWAWALASAL
eukprot:500287-Pleurochrysis_carterae.AAC.1